VVNLLAQIRSSYFSWLLVFLCLAGGCKAQTPSGALDRELTRRISLEIRSRYTVPEQINITLSEPKPSDVPGYDAISVSFTGGQHPSTHEFLISKDRKTLARLEKIDVSEDVMAKIDVKGRPVRGNEAAKVTIVNFDDFQCPYCSGMHATLFPGLLKEYGDRVKIIYRDYPLVEIHHWAMHAAVDANCLADQSNAAYWDFADYVHANQKLIAGHNPQEAFGNLDVAARDQATKHHLNVAKADACIKKQDETAVRASMAAADKLGVDSTPTLFVNGQMAAGPRPEEVRVMLNRALVDAGQQPPTPPAPTAMPAAAPVGKN
jgi:protein-disulfide isomerase